MHHWLTWIIFTLTYIGIAMGRIPGLALDRTGFALLGAIAMVASGTLTTHEAFASIDMPTILLLYALMIFSAQFRLGGFYTWVAHNLVRCLARPRLFLLALMGTSALLSALLANDIVCLAFTPVLCVGISRAGLNPIPFLIGLAVSSNIGSAATIIGNPQNMLIGQVGHLDFAHFLAWCLPPSLAALLLAYGIILAMDRKALAGGGVLPLAAPPPQATAGPALDAHQSRKGGFYLALLILLFFTHIPREMTALALAGVLLCSRRMHTRSLLGLVDWHLITLFCGLFIVIRGFYDTGLPALVMGRLAAAGYDIVHPQLLTAVSFLLSNLVSNVPACMLLTQFLPPDQPLLWYILAVSSTFAGNFITIGSLANLIVIEQAQRHNVDIGFRAHARIGIPVTLGSLAVLAAWILLHSA